MEALTIISVICWTLCFDTISAVSRPQLWNDVLVINRDIGLSQTKDAETNRNLHLWWDEFRAQQALWDSQFDEKICTVPEELEELHAEMVHLHGKMQVAWDLKQEQLMEIKAILYHINYADTGLANVRSLTGDELVDSSCEDIADYVENANLTAMDEKDKLLQNNQEIEDMGHKMDTHPCPCVWDEWGEWTTCTTTCEAGTTVRERPVKKEAINNGTECHGDSLETDICNDEVCCPVDCVWREWGEWQNCPSGCGAQKLRTRTVLIPAFCNGDECEGPDFEEMPCSREAELAAKAAELEHALEECQA